MNGVRFPTPAGRQKADAVELVVSGLTHDVRGALSGIKLRALSAADDLADGNASGVRQSLARIGHVVGWISELCDDLLECSRRRDLAAVPELVRFDLSERVLDCMSAQFASQSPGAGAPELSLQPNAWVFSHPRSIDRILVNLVQNAVRYGGGGKISVLVAVDGPLVSLTVRDSGHGIAQDVIDRLLAPFERGERSDASFQSFGLGLWIVSSLVASIGGVLEVRSQLGVGTDISVKLPSMALRTASDFTPEERVA